ncbi:putative serine protease HhoB precursor [Pseudobythopirellula maris]|uniref:Putative serine protease HhoB n=1 Tax=Pseudobythopirellula maris TaxID=2527991 RepID=A0A5C5ZJ27_9BACT|nr:trypsin-like peptidase domain-containing protein [Pseudobythopirellula maris]TWT87160.1 putative serine protease HhoB precursor [Pseudobythopirellula maris]
MTSRTYNAGQREAGAVCPHCGTAVRLDEPVAVCDSCGEVHHDTCWQLRHKCGSYECAAPSGAVAGGAGAVISISSEDLASAQPLPPRSQASTAGDEASPRSARDGWNRTAIWAFVVALLGVPLFGLVTGLIAIVVACIALVGHVSGRRGAGLAVFAIVLGLADVVGWSVGLAYFIDTPHGAVALNDLDIDAASFDDLPEHLARAMLANVMVHSVGYLGQSGMGSGVVLSISEGSAYIVTNRHVVDHRYASSPDAPPKDADSLGKSIQITTLEHKSVPGTVEWLAPHGIDLAIVSAPVFGEEVRAARWDLAATPRIGDNVFAVGNPHGFGWTHSAGDISQVRRQEKEGYRFRIFQTTAAINPGNSGGGLYDADGRLIGINTMTGDKRFAEGLGFSIALPTLLELAPRSFGLPDSKPRATATTNETETKP